MSLGQYLGRRARELLRDIEFLSDKIAEKEKELEEIRLAAKAIGVTNSEDETSVMSDDTPITGTTPMRIMTIRTLKERFPSGATITQIIEHIKGTWGRDIDRNNLSPLLSKMYQHGHLGRIPSTKGWFLVEPEKHIQGFRPYFDRRADMDRIVWCQPETVANDPDYEPLRLYGRGASE